MTTFRKKNGALAPTGSKKERIKALAGTAIDDVLILGQLQSASSPTVTVGAILAFTAANTHTGAETHSGVETHSGNETHSGLEEFSTGIKIDNITPLANTFVTIKSSALVQGHTAVAIPSNAVATAAQVALGYITSTSLAPTSITLPTGTLLGTTLNAGAGTIHKLYIDNTGGASTITLVASVNGILSALGAANIGSAGLLTVPSGVTGQAEFTLMFSSSTAFTFTRTA